VNIQYGPHKNFRYPT